MTQLAGLAVKAARQFGVWLTAGIAVCLAVAVCLFFWVDISTQRVPYLNVQVLPDEVSEVKTAPDETLARPLFWEGRRPVEPVVADEASEQVVESVQELEGVRLLGILAKGNNYTALLNVDGKVERVRRGGVVKQWNVTRVTGQEVHFSYQGSRSVLSLERETHQSIKLEL